MRNDPSSCDLICSSHLKRPPLVEKNTSYFRAEQVYLHDTAVVFIMLGSSAFML